MKKLFIMAMAAVAISFTSCGNKTQNAAPADENTEISTVAEAAKGVVDKLKEQIEAGDSKAIGEAIQTAVEKLAELVAKGDTEAAKKYQEQIKNFIDENADKIKEVTGGDEAVSKLIEIEDAVNAAGESIKDGAEQAVEDAKDAAKEKIDEAKEKAADVAEEKIDEAKEKASKAAEDLLNKIKE